MRSFTAARSPQGEIDAEDQVVRAWRIAQLARLGLALPVAEAVADHVDWHEVARLVKRGCPPSLAAVIAG